MYFLSVLSRKSYVKVEIAENLNPLQITSSIVSFRDVGKLVGILINQRIYESQRRQIGAQTVVIYMCKNSSNNWAGSRSAQHTYSFYILENSQKKSFIF